MTEGLASWETSETPKVHDIYAYVAQSLNSFTGYMWYPHKIWLRLAY